LRSSVHAFAPRSFASKEHKIPQKNNTENTSVADLGCLSRIPDPDFYPSRIPDPGSRIPDPKTATKERGGKKIFHTIFCSHKFHKIKHYFIFEMLKKII
jgi:hypothetical protein